MRIILIGIMFLLSSEIISARDLMRLEISGQVQGLVDIELLEDLAPNHVDQIKNLVSQKEYDGVVFHRVIQGFMAQSGDVMFGNLYNDFQPTMVGRGGSQLNDLKAEFSAESFDRGIVGMARSQDPNSANSQFFIMLADGHFLNGKYTVFGKVISGMDIVDQIKKGNKENNGMISKDPDFMKQVTIIYGD